MKEIAIIAYYFPPFAEVGHKRPLRLANYLAAKGWKVTVYSASRFSIGHPTKFDESLLKSIHPGVKVVRTPSIHLFQVAIRLRDSLRKKAAQRATGPTPAGESAPQKRGGLGRLIDAVQDAFRVPDPYTGWILTTLPVLLMRHVARPPHAIIATGPPWSPHVLARLAGRALRVPYYLDYRDPWNLNPEYWAHDRPLSQWLERKTVAGAAGVVANTSSLCDALKDRHGGRTPFHYVPNGFDAETRRSLDGLRKQGIAPDADRFVVSHIGTLYWQRMPPLFAETLARIAAAWPAGRGIRFRFVGWMENPGPLRAAFERHGAGACLELVGTVDTLTAKQELLRADVLLLLQPGYHFQVPAKLFEYALAGRPLLCLLEPGSELLRLAQAYALGMIAQDPGDVEGMGNFLAACREGRAEAPDLARFFQDFDGERLNAEMERILEVRPAAYRG